MITDSILNSTKKILGIDFSYTAFDTDILTHINSTFSTLEQLGIGPSGGYFIQDADKTWDMIGLPNNQLNAVKTYMYLKVRMVFDPPTTSYLISSMERQIEQSEFRLTVMRDEAIAALEAEEESEEMV